MSEAFYIAQHRPARAGADRPAQGRDQRPVHCARSSTPSTSPATIVPGSARPRRRCERTAELLRQRQAPGAVRGPRRGDLAAPGPAITRSPRSCSAPIVNTLLGKGAVDETHPLHLGMLGMHGTAYANKAVIDCDLIMAIGARWDDRITGKVERVLHRRDEHPRRHRPGRVQQDRPSRRAAARRCAARDRGPASPTWSAATATSGSRSATSGASSTRSTTRKQGGLRAQHVLDRLDALTKGDALHHHRRRPAPDVGRAVLPHAREPHWLSSGGAGTMGFGFPAAIGAQFALPGQARSGRSSATAASR